MPKGERTKELSFRLWKEGKSLGEIQAQISGDSKNLQESVKQWITEWERGRQGKWDPVISN
jgi:ribonuclease HI